MKSEFETKHIEPVWQNIFVTQHAINQYVNRVVEESCYAKSGNVIKKLKYVLLEGRRSDRDPLLLIELEPWLRLVKWEHSGRPVSIWMNPGRVCCLVVRDKIKQDHLVVLTCFKAKIKENANTTIPRLDFLAI
jgi:hypothetical protein